MGVYRNDFGSRLEILTKWARLIYFPLLKRFLPILVRDGFLLKNRSNMLDYFIFNYIIFEKT